MLDSLFKSTKKKEKDSDQRNQRVEDVLPQESEETGSQPYLPAFTASAFIEIPKESPSLENSEESLPTHFTPPHELIQHYEDNWHVGSPPGVHQYRRKCNTDNGCYVGSPQGEERERYLKNFFKK